MKTTLRKCFWVPLALLVFSCSNDESVQQLQSKTDESPIQGIEVVKLSNYGSHLTSRSVRSEDNDGQQYVLKFKDANCYDKIVSDLKDMNPEQKMDFFGKIGFKGAYYNLNKADDELDKIFDIDNDESFLNAYKVYKEKYKSMFVFNQEDRFDLSAYHPFNDENLELVGNNQGYIIIGDNVIAPTNATPNYEHAALSANTQSVEAPVNPIYRSFIEDCSVVIHKGKYRSDISLGIDQSGNIFMVRCASQKKKRLWKRRHATNYEADLYINGEHLHLSYPNDGRGRFEKVIPFNARQFFGRNIKCEFQNFTTGCCEGVYGNREFNVSIR
ncbi:DUF4848 domain-containing protein [Bacteroides ihuae]|uniref:DUF4848 domain-containing protein n=1 Tax=Bacteroides ihuae TaxID=1852362 RepID=UPI0008DADEBE|nr:DUF4848 domain-containing protein [Bacteroides ihuae]